MSSGPGADTTSRLAQHAARARADYDAQARLRLLLVDYLALAVAGSRIESAQAARRALAEPRRDGAVIEGGRDRSSREAAAFVNAVAAHGLELDDTHEPSSTHPGVAVWPAVLALADGTDATVADVLAAAGAGYDVMTAAGELADPARVYARGFHPTSVAGALGAAAACARLRGLDERTTEHALALAADLACGSLQFLDGGAWTKRLNAGSAASAGVRAVRLAEHGFRGPEHAVEGRHGWLARFGDPGHRELPVPLEPGRGALTTSVKLYACCRYMHGGMDLLVDAHRRLGEVAVEDVRRVQVAVIAAGQDLVSRPAQDKLEIRSSVDAQFSLPFGAALALSTGRARLADFDDAAATAARLRPWMALIGTTTSAQVEAAYPSAWIAEVRIELASGETLELRTDAFRGSPSRPAGVDDILEKAGELLGAGAAAALMSAVHDRPTIRAWNLVREEVAALTTDDLSLYNIENC